MTDNKIIYQLVPPHNHQTNLDERDIQTFINHFKTGLATVDLDFPFVELDRLLPQAVITLNLLQASRLNPKFSAHVYIFGDFKYNAAHLVSPGTQVLSHAKPSKKPIWAPNRDNRWYVGPSLDRYRCVNVYIPFTRAEITMIPYFYTSSGSIPPS